jgi:diguanylate cyclase (GGDEF)-like protein
MAIEAEAEDVTTRLQAEFPHALESGQVVAYFQPEIELSSGKIVAAESLARWEHPVLGTLSPALFVPLAEKLGLMGEFTQLMLRLSLAQHRTWAADGWDIPISVNVGPDCMKNPEFPAVVAEILRSEQVSGRMLALEVSEQTGTAAVSPGFFAQLAELGVRVALDDFGTGFASLESLGGWPVYELKLDMSIVRPIASNSSFRTIVRTTIDLAHQLGVEVVAEGVESEAVRSELEALGCDLAQGFLFGRPMPGDMFADWLQEHQRSAQRRGAPGQQSSPAETAATDGDTGEMGSAYRRLADAGRRVVDLVGPGTLAAAVGMFAVYGLWQVFRWGGHRHQALIGDLAFFPVNGAVALCAWRVSLRKDLGRAACRAWRLLSVALWLYLLGDMLQLVYEVVLHKRAYPTWADAAYLSFYVVALVGLLTFPSRRRTRSERIRLLLDMGTVFVGGFTLIWYVALGPVVAYAHDFDLADVVTYSYPVGDLLLLFGMLALLWRGTPRLSVASLRIFASGLVVFIAADMTYDYITANSTYLGGDPVDTLWFLALTILLIATGCQLRAAPAMGFATPARALATRPPLLPYLAVAGSYLLLIIGWLKDVAANSPDGMLLGGVLVGAVVLTAFVCARQFAALSDNGRLAVRYAALASIDGMTGLYNHRHFMEMTEGAFAHAQRLGQPLVALMIDVDRFKQINDVHGHAVGDRVLAELAQACREQVRTDDIAGRYGGDEFIVVIPGTTTQRAAQIADQLTGPPATIVGRDGTPVPFTVSVGIAESTYCPDLQGLLARADLAMYEAKRAGGGCWRIFESKGQVPNPALPTPLASARDQPAGPRPTRRPATNPQARDQPAGPRPTRRPATNPQARDQPAGRGQRAGAVSPPGRSSARAGHSRGRCGRRGRPGSPRWPAAWPRPSSGGRTAGRGSRAAVPAAPRRWCPRAGRRA